MRRIRKIIDTIHVYLLVWAIRRLGYPYTLLWAPPNDPNVRVLLLCNSKFWYEQYIQSVQIRVE